MNPLSWTEPKVPTPLRRPPMLRVRTSESAFMAVPPLLTKATVPASGTPLLQLAGSSQSPVVPIQSVVTPIALREMHAPAANPSAQTNTRRLSPPRYERSLLIETPFLLTDVAA